MVLTVMLAQWIIGDENRITNRYSFIDNDVILILSFVILCC